MLNTVQAIPIDLPHIPDDVDDAALAKILDCMTFGVCYQLTDRISLEAPTPDMNAEMGLCWINPHTPGAATVYLDGKPFAFQNVEWVQNQFKDVKRGYQLTGVESGRIRSGA